MSMREPEAAATEADLRALRALEDDASELQRIGKLPDRFNVFETIGFVKDELMHSNFLAFLLDPKRDGSLGDLFLRELLRQTLGSARETLSSVVLRSLDGVFESLDLVDLDRTLVRREHRNIDILLTNETHRFAVIIENKVWSTEHSGQLDEYQKIVKHTHPGWPVLGIYLTPNGDAPSCPEDKKRYVPLGYGTVCEILEEILKDRGPALSDDVRVSVDHYIRMVRRGILGDPEVVRQCREMYRKHVRAFNLIYQHRPDFQAQIRPVIENLVRDHPRLRLDETRKDNIKFSVEGWDKSALKAASDWTESGLILLFLVYNNHTSLDLHLYLGPGPEATRQRLLHMVRNNPVAFLPPRNVGGKWLSLFSRHLLKQEAYEEMDDKALEEEIAKQWNEFLARDLPSIEEALKKESWIWGSAAPEGSA